MYVCSLERRFYSRVEHHLVNHPASKAYLSRGNIVAEKVGANVLVTDGK